MRLSTAFRYEQSINNLQQRQQELSTAQTQLTSGKRVNAASDDPTAAARAERALASIARTDADQRAVDASKNAMTIAESVLGDAVDLLQSARAWIKLSGGYLVSTQRTVEDPALDALAASYLRCAPDRVLWGSDWPHATASAGVQPMPDDARQIDRLHEWMQQAGVPPRRVLVDNPQALYGFFPL